MPHREEEPTLPHLTRHDMFKTGLYVAFALSTAILLIGGTIWLFIAG